MYDLKDTIWDMTCPTPIHSTVAPAYDVDTSATASYTITFLMRSLCWNIVGYGMSKFL